jgi:hypothetical protein
MFGPQKERWEYRDGELVVIPGETVVPAVPAAPVAALPGVGGAGKGPPPEPAAPLPA